MLKLEAGKRYWRRDGGVSGPLKYYSGYAFCFRDEIMSWKIDGAWCANGESPGDLVREYTDPQPLQWKRGIPTEEECRECWLMVGGDGELPFRIGAHCHGPDSTEQRHWKDRDWYVALRIEPPKPKTRTVTQRQYFSATREELWTDHDNVDSCWTATGETRTREVPCE